MGKIVPGTVPQITAKELQNLVGPFRIKAPVYLVGVRGYYKSTMGDPAKNDRGIYDDAIMLVAPSHFTSYNANTDPSITRKHVAALKPGLYLYKLGIHGLSKPKAQQYQALVQAEMVTVARDLEGDETGFFGINIHRGGYATTSSLGCQTIYPDQWASFIACVKDQLARNEQKFIPYLLIEPA